MLKKFIATVAGSAVTFGLLFLMQALIASGHSAIKETTTTRVVDFVRVKREERLESKKSKPQRPTNPDSPPPDVPQPSLDNQLDSGMTSGAAMNLAPVPTAGVAIDVGPGFGIASGSVDGDYLPIVKVAPVYPRRAVERGIEGYVIVMFTVTKTGAIKDPTIVEAQPPTIFNRAALAAAQKFKYKPRIVNGEAIEVLGVLNKITFILEDE